jgi:hypothetical protein
MLQLAVEQRSDGQDRLRVIQEVGPFLPKLLRQDAIELAQTIAVPEARLQAVLALGRGLPNSLRLAPYCTGRTAAIELKSDTERAAAFAAVTTIAPKDRLGSSIEEAAEAFKSLPNESYNVWSWFYRLSNWNVRLSQRVRSVLVPPILAAVQQITEATVRADTWREAAKFLEGAGMRLVWHEALADICMLSDIHIRSHTLGDIVRFAPYRRRLDIAEEILVGSEAVTDPAQRFALLLRTARAINGELKTKVIRATIAPLWEIRARHTQIDALKELITELPAEMRGEILQLGRNARNNDTRAIILSLLAPRLHGQLRRETLLEAYACSQTIGDYGPQSAVLVSLLDIAGPEFPSVGGNNLRRQIVEDALRAANTVELPHDRAKALAAIIPHLPRRRRRQIGLDALCAVSEISKETAPYIPDQVKGDILEMLADCVPPGLLISIARAVKANNEPLRRCRVTIAVLRRRKSRANEYVARKALQWTQI